MRRLSVGRTVFGVMLGSSRGWLESQARVLAAALSMVVHCEAAMWGASATRKCRQHTTGLHVVTGDFGQTTSWVAYARTGLGPARAMSAALGGNHPQSCGVCHRTVGGRVTKVSSQVLSAPPVRRSPGGILTSGLVPCRLSLPLAQCESLRSQLRSSCRRTRTTSLLAFLGGALRRTPGGVLCRTCGP